MRAPITSMRARYLRRMAFTRTQKDDLRIQWAIPDLDLLPISGLSLVMGESWPFLSQKDAMNAFALNSTLQVVSRLADIVNCDKMIWYLLVRSEFTGTSCIA